MKFYFRKLNKIKLQQKLDPQEVIRFSEQSAVLEAEGLDVGSSLLSAVSYSAWCLHLLQMPTLPFSEEWWSMWQVKAQNQDDLGGMSNREGTERTCMRWSADTMYMDCMLPRALLEPLKSHGQKKKAMSKPMIEAGFCSTLMGRPGWSTWRVLH